jgi:hypothetical protein
VQTTHSHSHHALLSAVLCTSAQEAQGSEMPVLKAAAIDEACKRTFAASKTTALRARVNEMLDEALLSTHAPL